MAARTNQQLPHRIDEHVVPSHMGIQRLDFLKQRYKYGSFDIINGVSAIFMRCDSMYPNSLFTLHCRFNNTSLNNNHMINGDN